MLALAVVLVIGGYGLELLHTQRRPSPLFAQARLLRPSGSIGINLGMLGVLMFFLIYLYPLRKKWGWLGRMGNSRHWLDFHVVLGTAARRHRGLSLHLQFGNIAGMAFYSMLMVTISGFVGRYLYAHIPRGLSAAELSMKEIQEKEEALRKELAEQRLLSAFASMRFLTCRHPPKWQGPLDRFSPFHVSARPQASLQSFRGASARSRLRSLAVCRLRTVPHPRPETRARSPREAKTGLALQSIAFLARTQKIFQLWHVIHRPFSYAFAILAILHIGIALFMGYRL